MNELKDNYYIGFEGEPEITISAKEGGELKILLRIWDGYFNSIMQQIKSESGKWTSLAYYYNLDAGWYDESPWLIENLEEAYQQLSNIDTQTLQEVESDVLRCIIKYLGYGIENNVDIFISYE